MTPRARILIADDEDGLRWVLVKALEQAGYDVTAVKDGDTALRTGTAEAFDLVFLDIRMTAHGTMDTAIQAMQRGAYDYLAKPFDLDEAVLLAERALSARRLTQEVARLKTGLTEVWEFGALIGRHPRMQDV